MTALAEAQAARAELHASTYWPASARSKTTHLWKCDQHLAAALAALNPREPQGTLRKLEGAETQQSGLFNRDPGSPDIGGLQVSGYTSYGVAHMAWNGQAVSSTGRSHIHDCVVEDIAANPPRAMDGTGEAGFWLGQRTLAERLVARRCAWMGMWTGAACDGSTIQDFQLLEMPHVGLYVEHVTANTVFQRFRIELQQGADGNAVNIEWTYGGKGSHDLTFTDFDIYVPAGCWGFFLDAGTYGCRILNGRIRGPGNAVAHPYNLADPSRPNLVDWASIDTSQLTGQRELVHANAIG